MPHAIITRRNELFSYLSEQRLNKNSIGFVPTMGALHEGHVSLIQKSSSENDCTVVSIFVNPKQFGPNEDFAKYPRTFQNDIDIATQHGAKVIFAPSIEEMYPQGFLTQVSVSSITEVLCGAHRPGHFNGVTTVVLLLMNLVQANYIYLGQKDFQQVQVIKKMANDLFHPTKVIMVPTYREKDGLAMSSRNRYLSEEARKKASIIPKALALIAKEFLNGEKSINQLLKISLNELKKENLTPQYLEFRKVNDLTQKYEGNLSSEAEAVVAIAQIIEFEGTSTRLIDNILLGNDSANTKALEDLIAKAF
ncbi:pantoate--beta-alanine ligase [Silvanigrella paludirubra]|uniref:pantoate--beta-alanine ligase n=1 Tax=Silvanigrella paludirubra TaxID=2499159 RepID=UPI00192A51C1|nr:pantoate--beta-alanine ligase [Silvanigrella paludirubra]